MEVHVNQIEKRSWVEVDLAQLKQNYLTYKKNLCRDSRIMAVIKADAYGHGDIQVARVLEGCGVNLFAVSNIDEAIGLRDAGIKGEILILGYTSPFYAKELFDRNLTQTIVSEEYAEALSCCGYRNKIQFAIDTGMNRIGLNSNDVSHCEYVIRNYFVQFETTGIFTHLCVADMNTEDCERFTRNQIDKFRNVVNSIKDLHLPYIHCCNSAGGLWHLRKVSDFDSFGNVVRLGIILYGLKPDYSNTLPSGIKPVLSWNSSVSMVKKVCKGDSIGYGRTYYAPTDRMIATVTTGYADGLSRHLSNKGFVIIHGRKAPIVGRICMDQTLVDVTDIPNIQMGDKVVILGESGIMSYTADDMAKDLDTIGYEVLCNISKRVQRFYTNSNANL